MSFEYSAIRQLGERRTTARAARLKRKDAARHGDRHLRSPPLGKVISVGAEHSFEARGDRKVWGSTPPPSAIMERAIQQALERDC